MHLARIVWKQLMLNAGQVAIPVLQQLPEKSELVSALVPHVFNDIEPGINARMVKHIQRTLSGRKRFRFAVMGDVGKTYNVFTRILAHALSQNPDFIIMVGDFLRSSKLFYYRKILEVIEDIPIPIVFIGGNHDLKGDGYTFFTHLFGPVHFHFDINAYRFIVLDTYEKPPLVSARSFQHQPTNGTIKKGISDEQLRSLSSLMEPDKRHFILMHTPPKGIWKHHCFKHNAPAFIDLLSEYAPSIARVFCGHLHGYGRKKHRGITYVVSAGCGGKFYHHDADIMERYNFVLVDVAENKVKDVVYFCDV